jgi:hypothetical protein
MLIVFLYKHFPPVNLEVILCGTDVRVTWHSWERQEICRKIFVEQSETEKFGLGIWIGII